MKKKLLLVAGALVLALLGALLWLFVIGEPIDGRQLACNVSQEGPSLTIQVTSPDSGMALKGWKIKPKGDELYLSARKVPVSVLFPSGEYQCTVEVDGIRAVYLGGQEIWRNSNENK